MSFISVSTAIGSIAICLQIMYVMSPSNEQSLLSLIVSSTIGAAEPPPSFRPVILRDGHPCNVEIVSESDLLGGRFRDEFFHKKPVIITNVTTNIHLVNKITVEYVVDRWGSESMMQADVYAASSGGMGSFPVSIKRYFETEIHAARDALENGAKGKHPDEVLYMYGASPELSQEMRKTMNYAPNPVLEVLTEMEPKGKIVPALGPAGTGIPFHQHFDSYCEQITGNKRWFMFTPYDKVDWTNHVSLKSWIDLYDNPRRKTDKNRTEILTCMQRPGEIFYVPGGWPHATMSMGEGFGYVWQSWTGAPDYATVIINNLKPMFEHLAEYDNLGGRLDTNLNDACEKTLETITKAVERHPNSPTLWARKALLLRIMHRRKEFFEAASKVLTYNRDNVNVLYHILHYSVQLGDVKRGLDALNRLRVLQKEYDLGVHTGPSRRLFKDIDSLQLKLRVGKPVPPSRLPRISDRERFVFS